MSPSREALQALPCRFFSGFAKYQFHSDVKKVFVSVFGDENSDSNARTKANTQAYLAKNGRAIEFFDAATTPVW